MTDRDLDRSLFLPYNADQVQRGMMDREKVQLILDTIESQVKLLKLEINQQKASGPQFLTEDLAPLLKVREDSSFVDYDPEYYEERD